MTSFRTWCPTPPHSAPLLHATIRNSGYYQTEWPRRTRAYEYGVYTDQVLQNFFMPGMYVLTNLSPA